MKIKCIIPCTGIGYENMKVGEEREVTKKLGKKLVDFGYVEDVTLAKPGRNTETPVESEEAGSSEGKKEEGKE